MRYRRDGTRLGQIGDVLAVISYASYTEEERQGHEPAIALVDEHNQPTEARADVSEATCVV